MKRLIGATLFAGWTFWLPAQAQELHVAKSIPHLLSFVPYDVAVEEGYFARQGLKTELSNYAGGGKIQAAMLGGEVDISLSAATDLPAMTKGLPQTGIAESTGAPAEFGVIVPANSPIHDLAGLKGKRIGISTMGSITEWAGRQLARSQGWGPDGVTLVAIGAGPNIEAAALKTHQIDADLGDVALAFQLEDHHEARLLAPVSSFSGPFIMHVIYASNSLLKTRPEDARRFMAGWLQAVAYMNGHKNETVTIAAKVTGLAPDVLARAYDLVMPSMSTDGKFDLTALDHMEQTFLELGLLKTQVDLRQDVTDQYLPK